jgi:hypothetical protein
VLAINARIKRWFDLKYAELRTTFEQRDLGNVRVLQPSHEYPPDSSRTDWFRKEIIDTAHRAGHFANFGAYAGWSGLRIRIEGLDLRYVSSVHGAGRDVGVMAVTTFGLIGSIPSERDEAALPREVIMTTKDAFSFVHTEPMHALDERGTELESLLDEGLSVGLSEMLRRVR